jgi:hypothetical protein
MRSPRCFRFLAARRRGKLHAVKARRRPRSASRPDPQELRLLRRTAAACRRSYRHRRNVLDVGVGVKYRAGRRSGEGLCVQFCVSRKLRRPGASRLPRFVYARRRDGSPDRRHRIQTDVVVVRDARFACVSGSGLDAPGERGTLTLLFRNRSDGLFHLLTCAHVAGSLAHAPPGDPRLESECCPGGGFATTLAHSVAVRGVVDWDVALARVEARCAPQPERRVMGSRTALRHLRSADAILPGERVECATASSGRFAAWVASDARSLRIRLDRVVYRVRNLFLLEARPRPGDSGGLVFDGDEAVGILVAVAGADAPGQAGWGLFQPLAGAIAHLEELCGFPLRVFGPGRTGGKR